MNLNFKKKTSFSGKSQSMIIFLHGYGADASDLIPIADTITKVLPDTLFLAPDAPNQCQSNPFGRQWFPIPWLDSSSESESEKILMESTEILNNFINTMCAVEKIPVENTVLFGFSQGTMIGLHLMPNRKAPFAAIVGFSGRVVKPKAFDEVQGAKTPVLLVHGDQDQMVDPKFLDEAAGILKAAQYSVQSYVSSGTGHGIAPDGLKVAVDFLRKILYQYG